MKNTFFLLTLAALLFGCQNNDTQGVQEASDPKSNRSPDTRKASVDNDEGGLRSPLPEGVSFRFPHYTVLDTPVKKEGKPDERRTSFEYFQGDPEQAMDAVAAAMREAGFNAKPPKIENGAVRQAFSKEGYGHVNSRVQSEGASELKHPSAVGFIVMAWSKTDAPAASPVER